MVWTLCFGAAWFCAGRNAPPALAGNAQLEMIL